MVDGINGLAIVHSHNICPHAILGIENVLLRVTPALLPSLLLNLCIVPQIRMALCQKIRVMFNNCIVMNATLTKIIGYNCVRLISLRFCNHIFINIEIITGADPPTQCKIYYTYKHETKTFYLTKLSFLQKTN